MQGECLGAHTIALARAPQLAKTDDDAIKKAETGSIEHLRDTFYHW